MNQGTCHPGFSVRLVNLFSFCYNGQQVEKVGIGELTMDHHVPSVTIEEVLSGHHPIIDVRTPNEFAEFHIPNAVNVPIFSNDERAEVGTAYTQESPDTAKQLGVDIVSRKLPGLYKMMKEIDEENDERIVVHCWRGGMRSRTIVSLMNALEIPCCQLEGGIRSFRRLVVRDLETFAQTAPDFIILEGFTGTRKTDILLNLQREGYPVLDLEGMAGHRGSAFGAIGLKQNSQKQFECNLWQRLHELKGAPYILIEAESKRIGDVILPDFILDRKRTGKRIHVTYPFHKRIETLCRTYEPHAHKKELRDAVSRIEKRIDTQAREDLHKALAREDYPRFAAILLEYYYDPRYRHSENLYNTTAVRVNMKHFHEGLQDIKQAIKQIS